MSSSRDATVKRPLARHESMLVDYTRGDDEEHSKFTRYLSWFLSSKYLDAGVLLFVLLDVACVGIESSIDLQFACVRGRHVDIDPEVLADIGLNHAANLAKEEALLLVPPRQTHALYSQKTARTNVSSGVGHLHHASSGAQPPYMPTTAFTSMLQASVTLKSQELKVLKGEAQQKEEEKPGALVCETRNDPTAHHIAHTAHLISIFILCLFVVEIFAKIYVDYKVFFASKWEILDLVVVMVSLLMDTVVEAKFEGVVEVLIVARLWRFVRLVHGFIEIMDSEEGNIERLKEEIKEAKARLAEVQSRKSAGSASRS